MYTTSNELASSIFGERNNLGYLEAKKEVLEDGAGYEHLTTDEVDAWIDVCLTFMTRLCMGFSNTDMDIQFDSGCLPEVVCD